ncbi:hypothetical protein [Microbacterium sp. T32]|uniref:hypothetical protein n=1 Tax=Microbacterium sp. T32 TaxID=1776083 RepID=UPI0007ABA3EE|nr:hypothetical protein [Microbacterium sp. T32]KZE41371.1 hypothetical protein AVW09_01945 [Microbacterium sp. T32]
MTTPKRRTIRGIAAVTIVATAALGLTACGDRPARDCRPEKISTAAAAKIVPAPVVVRPPAPRPPVVVRPPAPKPPAPKPVAPAAPKPVQPAPNNGSSNSGFHPSSPWFWFLLFNGSSNDGRGC